MSSRQASEGAQARAETRFKMQEQRASDAQKVNQELEAAKVAERLKTERLRALRLAKEEADRAAAAAAPPPTKKTSARKARVAS